MIEKFDLQIDSNSKRYTSAHDANMRLSGTFISFDKRPIYVNGVYNEDSEDEDYLLMTGSDYSNGNSIHFYANDSRLDVSSLPLGFLLLKKNLLYLSRAPIRSQKQGIDIGRLNYQSVSDLSFRGRGLNFTQETARSIVKLFKGEFPTFETALELSMKKAGSSFSRSWAVVAVDSSLFKVFHKTELVGFYIPKDKTFLLSNSDSSFLKQSVLETILYKQNFHNFKFKIS